MAAIAYNDPRNYTQLSAGQKLAVKRMARAMHSIAEVFWPEHQEFLVHEAIVFRRMVGAPVFPMIECVEIPESPPTPRYQPAADSVVTPSRTARMPWW